jgi:hypothetical protein
LAIILCCLIFRTVVLLRPYWHESKKTYDGIGHVDYRCDNW